MKASTASTEASIASVEALMDSVEASMEAWKLPWKRSRHGNVEVSMGITPTEYCRGIFHGRYFFGGFRESILPRNLLRKLLPRKLA